MREETLAKLASAAALACVLALPAQAQKTQDTLRLATSGQTVSAVTAEAPQPETDLVAGAVFDGLLCYDVQGQSFHPLLAKSWTQIDDRTMEFELRDDVAWQDGSPFTAEDVIYTFNYMIDPSAKLRFAPQNFEWLDHVEAVGPHKIRVYAKKTDPLELLNMAILGDILPKKLHSAYATPSDFGRTHPIGTGPYRVVSISPTAGVSLARYDGYRHGDACKPAASIGRIEVKPIADGQTQMAQLLTGGIDLMRVVSKSQADLLADNAELRLTPVDVTSFLFMIMDALGRSGHKEFTDEKVRQAAIQAIDRRRVAESILPAGKAAQVIDALCVPFDRACKVREKPYPYDPAAAKRLLAEAGYRNGFDVTISTLQGVIGTLAEAISGELRAVGIRAKVEPLTVAAYFQRLADGNVTLGVASFGLPDAATNVDLFFDGSSRDYWRDAPIEKLAKEGREILDPQARDEIYRTLFDRMNQRAFVLPLATNQAVFVHGKNLAVPKAANNRYGLDLDKLRWE
jgi:peptide/nickel transport system substrate-binding protein